jgi:hypothetical protein
LGGVAAGILAIQVYHQEFAGVKGHQEFAGVKGVTVEKAPLPEV